VYLSVRLDLPTGATIVCTFGGVLVLMFLAHVLLHHRGQENTLKGARSARREERRRQGETAEPR
jgi:hypothetical protein